jgi:hypothetical protein
MEIKLLIDGDWLVYAAGFAGQKTKYFAPQLGNEEFDNMTEVKNEAKAQNDGVPDTGAVYSRTIVDPLGHILHSAKNMLNGAIEKAEEKFDGHTVTPVVYVDGDGNFRNRIATIRPYKGNRVSAKPVAFVDIKDYLVDQWGAQIVYDQESDDQMAIDSGLYEFPVICSVDKDMLQVPGWHLNPNKGWKRISGAEGLLRLYVQAAQGDATDNIGGAYKVGPKKAQAVFFPLKGTNELVLWEALVEVYDETIEKYGVDTYFGLTAEEAALENMRLVYLRRTEGEIWVPPSER